MTDTSLSDELDDKTRTLDSDLRNDRCRVVPDEKVPELPQDIVFFAEDAWRQMLTDLGYSTKPTAPIYEALSWFADEAERDPGLADFGDAINTLKQIAAWHAPDRDDNLFAVDDLLETVLHLLSLEGATEADKVIVSRPAAAEVSVRSRIIQARLDLLGLLADTGVGHPWGEQDDAALRRLSRLLTRPDAGVHVDLTGQKVAELIMLSGDADAMIARLRDRDPGGFIIAGSGHLLGRRAIPFKRLKIGTDGLFSTAPLIRLAPALERIKRNGRTTLRIAKPLHRDTESARADMSNTLGLRLIQIRLMQGGYYNDRIDAIFGQNTLSAILEAAEIFGKQSVSENAPDLLRRLDSNCIAINLHGLHKLIFSFKAESEFTPEAADFMAKAISGIVERRGAEDPQLNGSAHDAPKLRRDALNKRPKFLGRLKRGVGRMIRSIATAVRRGLHNMAMVVDRMLAPIRDVLGVAFEQIDKARSLIVWALKAWRTFIFGQPLIVGSDEEGFVTARFAIDHDARLIFLNNPSDSVLETFRSASNRLYHVLRLSLNAAVTIINLLRSLATWRGRIRLVFELAALLQRQVTYRRV